jgi:hypothetical protein
MYGAVMLNGTPYIEVKKARIARAGNQVYTASEMKARTAKFMDSGKGLYTEHRPPEVLIKNLEKFNYVPFINEHTPFDLTPDNWKQYAIGVVGGNASVEVVNDEVYVTNDVVFYDREAYDEYKNGKVELSARYDAKFALVKEADQVGYDSVLLDIPSVNHVALVERARAGHDAKIVDSLGSGNRYRGLKMLGGFLSFMGIGKAKDSGFKFSDVLMDSLGKVKADATVVEKEVSTLAEYVATLGDSEAREVLAGAVADCYKNVEAVLAKKDEVGKRIDELYCKCQDADTEVVKRILEGTGKVGDEEAKKNEEDEKSVAAKEKMEKEKDSETKTNDAASLDSLVNAAVEKVFAKVSDSIDAKIDAAMKKVLGTGTSGTGSVLSAPAAPVNDGLGVDEDASYLVRGVFGKR